MSEQDFESAKTEFTNMLPDINQKRDELKALKKVHNIHKQTIYKYMTPSTQHTKH